MNPTTQLPETVPDVPRPRPANGDLTPSVISFDIEEHHRIEAASGLTIAPSLQAEYRLRMSRTTRWILEQLADRDIRATFFIVGEIAHDDPGLIREIVAAGHEVASHGWDHRRILVMDPDDFREDLRTSKDALEQAGGAAVLGYRAPTFSLVRQTAWALDVLAELGFQYDSSVYPVRHDRYGIHDAPRGPFLAQGDRHEILEIPPATIRVGGFNLPMGGGGYFRLLPWAFMRRALDAADRDPALGVTMLYFHPWEFEPDQPRLPLGAARGFRTYVGIRQARARLERLMEGRRFVRAIDLAARLYEDRDGLPRFRLTPPRVSSADHRPR